MPTPKLSTSNRLELLAHELAENLRPPLPSPFQPEIIVVQSQGMARWLKLQLAREHGICANCIFPFPKVVSRLIFVSAFPDLAEKSPFEPETLVWVILKQLPALLAKPEFASLKYYFGNDNDPRKLFQLADKIARLFDQYLVFRPEMIQEWDEGKTDGWQPRLWRAVAQALNSLPNDSERSLTLSLSLALRGQEGGRKPGGREVAAAKKPHAFSEKTHPAALQKAFLEFATHPKTKFTGTAQRVSIFGISALPKFYLQIFEALAPHTELSLYLLQPCAQWWGYISSDRETEKTLKRLGKKSPAVSELHLERGNRLLASLGQQGRDFLNLLHDFDWEQYDRFEDLAEDSLLHCIQSDVSSLRDRGAEGEQRTVVAPDDTSIQVHNCHSPLREMEVLHDNLLDWFAKDSTLAPHEILVMTPNIELYAPFIQAVFESPEKESHRIPVSVADRGPRSQSQVIQTFLKILSLPKTRLGATTILSILESPTVRQKCDLAEDDLALIRHWVEATGIRWGKDADYRRELGLPAISDHTWEQGLDRLLLGYAMPGKSQKLFHGILPFDVEGEVVLVLGKFKEFIEQLFETVTELSSKKRLSGWTDFLFGILETFFQQTDDAEADFQIIRNALTGLDSQESLAGFDRKVELDMVLEPLARELDQDHLDAGYLRGGVTFCALKPMRSIPFKIICLVGMNDGAFPRADSWLSFDLMAQNPRLGDRSSREDDRYLFLETLISSRQRFFLSYTGQSIRDNSEAPPSVLVSQLLDYVEQGFSLPDGNLLTDLVVTKHRLQAFSPAYFSGGRLFSYSQENLKASQSVQPDRSQPQPFLAEPLAGPENEFRSLTVETLAEFFCHPAKFLATHRLGVYLPKTEEALEEAEPFALDGLNSYLIKQQMLELRVEGRPLKDAFQFFKATGRLPAGLSGEATFDNLRGAAESFYVQLKPHIADLNHAPVLLELAPGEFQISGQFADIAPGGLLSFRCAEIKAKDLLRAWVRHVIWNTACAQGRSLKSKLIGTDAICEFREIENPEVILEAILQIYWRGLTQPLKFFPKSSEAFSRAEIEGTKNPLAKARSEWRGNDFQAGECEDPYFDLIFRHSNPIDDEFAELSRKIFNPLWAHVQETKL